MRTPSGSEGAIQYVPTGNPGEYRYRFRADEEGIYELDVQAQIDGKTHDANRLLLRVQRPGDELVTAVVPQADALDFPTFVGRVQQQVAAALEGADQATDQASVCRRSI